MAADSTGQVEQGEADVEEREFQTEVQQLLHLLIHSLYTNSEVFVRELISNASDALDKVHFRSLTDREIVDPDAALEIDITIEKDSKILTIKDTGMGMSRDEVNQNIGTIAHSGSSEFLKQIAASKDEEQKLNLIGQFGVGFYSVFMVADRVVVTTRSADPQAEAVQWESTGAGNYTVSTADKEDRGTEIKIYVRSDSEDYLDVHRLEQIIRRHSDFVAYPIKVGGKQANDTSALWTRPRNEITEEQYHEFYTHLSGDQEKPLVYEHIVVDAPIQFYSILYIPGQMPMNLLFTQEPKISLNLHVKRVFIQDDCKELLPLYLRFVRGVVDCDDLPLNVSRETLQHNAVIGKVHSNLVRRILKLLEDMAKNRSEDYEKFWRAFGIVLKEGVSMDFENKNQLAGLLRFNSSLSADPTDLVSLQEYADRMQSDQKEIYYLTGESREVIAQSPLLEAFRKRNLEVLFMGDPVDEWVVNGLQKFADKDFKAIDAADLDLGEETKLEGVDQTDKEQTIELVSYLKKELEGRVADVVESSRLTDSPCVLVVPQGGMGLNMERLMKMTDQEFAPTKRILEVNPGHPIISNMGAALKKDRDSEQLKEWSQFLVDYVLLGEGTVEDPQRVTRALGSIMSAATDQGVKEA